MAKILTKMSVKTLGGDPSEAKSRGAETPVARVYGVASGMIQKPGKDGEIVNGLTGQFKGVALNGQNKGEEFQSGVLYLPGGIQELVESAVWDGESDTNGKPVFNSVRFALDIAAYPASNPIGYSYNANPLMDAEENDPLADIANALPALPKPAPANKDAATADKGGAKDKAKTAA